MCLTLITIVLRVSITLMVFALGLRVSLSQTTHLLRMPALLARSILSLNIVVPLCAMALVATMDLDRTVAVALIGLSISPVPPLLPIKQLKAGGGTSFIFSLLAIEAVLAILFVPISVEIFNLAFSSKAQASPGAIASVVLLTIVAPMGAGVLGRHAAPVFADRMAKPLSIFAGVLLAGGLIPILILAMPAVVSLICNGTLAAITAFTVAGLGAGHLLGGPKPENRIVLALASASRHPGVAMSIASASLSDERLLVAALLLYLIVNALVSLPYLVWRRRADFSITRLSDLPVSAKSRCS